MMDIQFDRRWKKEKCLYVSEERAVVIYIKEVGIRKKTREVNT